MLMKNCITPKAAVAALLALCTSSFAQADDVTFTIGDFTYTELIDGIVQIAASQGASITGELTIPATVTYNGTTYTIGTIAENGFKGQTGITSVTIKSDGYELEGELYGLEISQYAFYNCTSITSVSATNIGSIGKSAFYDNTSLASVDLTEGLAAIGDYAFYNCYSLTSVTFPTTLETIGLQSFQYCSSLQTVVFNYKVGDGSTYGLKSIGENAFCKAEKIEKLTFPITLQKIGAHAFDGNTSLKEITLPKSITELSDYCFMGCKTLEKVSFEGGTDLAIPSRAFAYCDALNEIVIGEGVSSLSEYAFSTCSSLKKVTLPKSLLKIGANAFYDCTALDTLKCYAETAPEFESTAFSSLKNAVLLVPDPENYSNYKEYFSGGIEKLFTFDDTTEEEKPEEQKDIEAGDTQSFDDAFHALSDANGAYSDANVTFTSEITLTPTELDLGVLSANNIFATLDRLPTVEEYNGTFNGSTVANLATRTSGLFGTLGENAKVDGLALDNATLYVDLTDEDAYTQVGNEVFIHLLAKKNAGSVTNFGFHGQVIVDEDLAKGKDISICLVDEDTEDATLTGFIYLDEIVTTGSNKRCITIKQNLGVRNSKTAKIKMARQKLNAGGNKSLDGEEFTYTEEELNKMEREFDDNEFASGVVAYWLNYEGAGYTGNYSARWSQGKTVPVAATVKNGVTNALYAVDYGTTDMNHITSGKRFANNGSQITITYDERPESITVGGTKLVASAYGDNSVTLKFDHTKAIVMNFATKPTAATAPNAQVKVSVSGREISISGANGETKTLYSLTGATAATTAGNTLSAPAAGLYLVRVGKTTTKVIVK